ncbi:RNA polymerase sigma factor [Agromyces ramosus]|uniref:RNA polymerase sigma-70 factor (ECF subfamily) n=1 Tax=Agromyces ramosus TaxID=33879 RepID=A0ABU0R9A1_9MICO|nr:RNA polymerase sigma factor [Agromyces ramosus]MDQ0893619.1 RNA polymerase sigma-70 factor (ECF subfamily) [Agromyces ramosus]
MKRRKRSAAAAHLERAYLANAADLLSYFGRRVRVAADAADLLSETFVVAWRRGDRMPADPEQARMWLFGVARRVLANAARGEGRHADLTGKLRAHLETVPTEQVDGQVLDVRAALDAIPADQSELVRLVLWDGFTVLEAATILGISESTARGRFQRARIRLRELLREHQYEGNA